MKSFGINLCVVGVILCVIAVMLPVSVDIEASYSSLGPSGPSSVINIGKLQNQMMVFQAGLAACLVGAIFAGAGHLEQVFRSGGAQSVDPRVVQTVETSDNDAAPAGYSREEESNGPLMIAGIVGAIILLIIVAAVMIRTPRSTEAAALEANADMLADNMEMMADNIDAMADAAAAGAR